MKTTRRDFIRIAGWTGVALFSPTFSWASATSQTLPVGYGPLQTPDVNGLQLPTGFTSRVVAIASERPSPSSSVEWHRSPDGGATFLHPDGGWVYVSNSEQSRGRGGVTALRFAADGEILDAYPILRGTSQNCGGGATPWGTWVSCEETGYGLSYECDPFKADISGSVRPALGRFKHEAIAVDAATGDVYLTEDESNSLLYRFRPDRPGDLSEGILEAAEILDPDGRGAIGLQEIRPLTWHAIPSPTALLGIPTRYQLWPPTRFNRGEGIACADGRCCFATTGDQRIWSIDLATQHIQVLYDARQSSEPDLNQPDNISMAPNGNVFVAEDAGNLEIVALSKSGQTAPILRLQGQPGTELTGPALSPNGRHFYFSSQRGPTAQGPHGITYEISGPFLGATDSKFDDESLSKRDLRQSRSARAR